MTATLIIGAGHRQVHWLPLVNGALNDSDEWPEGTIKLDNNPLCKPDVVWDLELGLPPFQDDSFDEIHAYEVLEHTGQQGDYRFFFDQFTEFWRVLKPGGKLYGSVPLPTSVWAWGDPSHKRIIPRESFVFLSQQEYIDQCDNGNTPMSDFRHLYHADFDCKLASPGGESLWFELEAVKPSRWIPSSS